MLGEGITVEAYWLIVGVDADCRYKAYRKEEQLRICGLLGDGASNPKEHWYGERNRS